jgi:hypothetical protein
LIGHGEGIESLVKAKSRWTVIADINTLITGMPAAKQGWNWGNIWDSFRGRDYLYVFQKRSCQVFFKKICMLHLIPDNCAGKTDGVQSFPTCLLFALLAGLLFENRSTCYRQRYGTVER